MTVLIICRLLFILPRWNDQCFNQYKLWRSLYRFVWCRFTEDFRICIAEKTFFNLFYKTPFCWACLYTKTRQQQPGSRHTPSVLNQHYLPASYIKFTRDVCPKKRRCKPSQRRRGDSLAGANEGKAGSPELSPGEKTRCPRSLVWGEGSTYNLL